MEGNIIGVIKGDTWSLDYDAVGGGGGGGHGRGIHKALTGGKSYLYLEPAAP